MKRIAFILAFGILYCSVLYAAEDKKELNGHPTPEEIQKAQQSSQQRPILPPVVPAPASMVSPTPSPHITAPQITQQVISQPAYTSPQISASTGMQNIPSIPTYAAQPTVPVPIEMPNVPVIGNTIGKVTNIGSEEDGSLWIEVNDNLFGELILVRIRNLKNTPIVKQASILNFKDIKIGDTVNAMYHTEGNDNIANFINVMTDEEIEMMNQSSQESELTVSPEEEPNTSDTEVIPEEETTQPEEE